MSILTKYIKIFPYTDSLFGKLNIINMKSEFLIDEQAVTEFIQIFCSCKINGFSTIDSALNPVK